MKSEFKNFGEALAWMMESPENVAVRYDIRYRFTSVLECDATGRWAKTKDDLETHTRYPWSRAKKEPKVFRLEGTVSHCQSGRLRLDDTAVVTRFAQLLAPYTEGTKVEVVLTVHEE